MTELARHSIAVAMSGGVDSLRAAVLLKEQGYDVVGLFMILSPRKKGSKVDPSARTKALGQRFNIPVVVVDLERDFEQFVISPFVEAYLKGLTPNPCVVCNPKIKFGFLLEFWKTNANEIGLSLGISGEPQPFLATGHYVSLVRPEENPYGYRYGIKRHKDKAKDQSYFLYGLSQEQLEHALFPLASETKQEVALWATSLGLQDLVAAESQEICFIPSGDYVSFLEERIPGLAFSSGPIKNKNGQILGYHRGLHRYTIGQRRGIGIPSSAPYYVIKISPEENTLYVGRKEELSAKTCYVRELNWVSVEYPIDSTFRASVKIRNQHVPALATIEVLEGNYARVCFDTPQNAVTPGQSAVFYDGEWLIGGGVIESSEQ